MCWSNALSVGARPSLASEAHGRVQEVGMSAMDGQLTFSFDWSRAANDRFC